MLCFPSLRRCFSIYSLQACLYIETVLLYASHFVCFALCLLLSIHPHILLRRWRIDTVCFALHFVCCFFSLCPSKLYLLYTEMRYGLPSFYVFQNFFLLCCFAELARVPLEKIYIRRSRTYMEKSFADVASTRFECFSNLFSEEYSPSLFSISRRSSTTASSNASILLSIASNT